MMARKKDSKMALSDGIIDGSDDQALRGNELGTEEGLDDGLIDGIDDGSEDVFEDDCWLGQHCGWFR
jgi:hypothetical protein